MSSAFVAALMAPLHELQAAVGTGVFTGDDDPTAVLRNASRALTDVASTGVAAASQVGAVWSGAAANAATMAISTALRGASDLAMLATGLAGRVSTATDTVAAAKAKLQRIVDEFEATAAALEPGLPGTAGALVDAARRAFAEATGVVAELEAELDEHASAVSAPNAPSAPSTAPAAMPTPAGMSSMLPAASGLLGAASPLTQQLTQDAMLTSDALDGGVAVRLPDGSTVTAPNEVAADAVRHALTQLGVPYDWGGTTPGVGLDCSGLTQWAYREAGLNLPRMADAQDVGAAVSPNALLPGDLAVWDGHVAMIVGNGMMIEAGDPVQLSPIRTSNLGQGFQGFWRPTA